MDFSNGPINSIIPQNIEINLDSMIHSPSMGSPKLEADAATPQLIEESFGNLSPNGIAENDVRGCTVIQNVREVSTAQEKHVIADACQSNAQLAHEGNFEES